MSSCINIKFQLPNPKFQTISNNQTPTCPPQLSPPKRLAFAEALAQPGYVYAGKALAGG